LLSNVGNPAVRANPAAPGYIVVALDMGRPTYMG